MGREEDEMKCIKCGRDVENWESKWLRTEAFWNCECGFRVQRTLDGKSWYTYRLKGIKNPWHEFPPECLLVLEAEEA